MAAGSFRQCGAVGPSPDSSLTKGSPHSLGLFSTHCRAPSQQNSVQGKSKSTNKDIARWLHVHLGFISHLASSCMHTCILGFQRVGVAWSSFSFAFSISFSPPPSKYFSLADKDQESSVPKICQMSDHLLIKKPLKIITGLFSYSCIVKNSWEPVSEAAN